eukprot:43091-Hanusia_phi.AAC.1
MDMQAAVFTFQSAFCFLGGIFAILRKSYMATFWIASAFHIIGVLELILAFPLNVHSRQSMLSWFYGIADLSYGLVLQFQDNWGMHLLPVYFCFTTFFDIAVGMSWFKGPFRSEYIGITTYVLLLIWFYFLFERNYLYRKAVKQIEPDRR